MKFGHTKRCEKSGYKYHCYVCSQVESAPANTLFHKVKLGLQKAFYVVFEMSTNSKSFSSIQMGKRFDIRQGTPWYFMQKVRKSMEGNQNYRLTEIVHVYELTAGGKSEGRSYDSKKKKVLVVELKLKHKIKRVYIKSIDDYSAKPLTPIFAEHISTTAKIVTDKWREYSPLKKKYNIEQMLGNNAENFKELLIVIMQLKSWLRAILIHVSKWHIQPYFDRFCFRINRSQFTQSIFHKTIQRMVFTKPIYTKNRY